MKAVIFLATLFIFFSSVCGARKNFYDLIVVGAGSAGSVVANRLSANPNNSVLLIEAGERPNLLSEIPNFYFYLQSSKYDWNFTVQMPSFPEFKLTLPPHSIPQGKVIGGSSSINGMIYTRGNKKDYDKWAKNGAVGWEWNNIYPLFKKSENNRDEDIYKNGYHGRNGELFVQRPKFRTLLADKYLEAAKELGYELGDVNGPKQEVFMIPQLTVYDGRRWGSHKAFTRSIEGRRNFKILTSTFVRKLLFDGNRATGVEVDYKGKIRTMWANKEIILSAGAINSPHLLMVSGIGPKKELEMHGIKVISDLPVGKNFHDQPMVIAYSKPINETIPGLSMSEVDYNEFLLNGRGILSDTATETIGFLSSKNSNKSHWPDIELIFITLIQPKSFLPNPNASAIPHSGCVSVLLRPNSRGEITLKSSDPYEYPKINPNYFSDDKDVKLMMEAVEKCRAFENTKELKDILTKSEIPIPECDQYIHDNEKYFRCRTMASVLPTYHLAGSCKMGDVKDPSSVVDPNLRVIGVKGLRVVDNSIMPTIASAPPYAIAVMIGEKAAEIILGEQSTKQH